MNVFNAEFNSFNSMKTFFTCLPFSSCLFMIHIYTEVFNMFLDIKIEFKEWVGRMSCDIFFGYMSGTILFSVKDHVTNPAHCRYEL